MRSYRKRTILGALLGLIALLWAYSAWWPVPAFIGSAATARPIAAAPIPPHPFMAPNERSNVHNDPYMSDTYLGAGPLGRSPEVRPSPWLWGVCVSIAFDQAGRLLTSCLNPGMGRLYLVDPVTLDPLASLDLPGRWMKSVLDFPPGSYFYLDEQDHMLVPTSDQTIWEVAVVDGPEGPRLERQHLHDLTSVVPEDDTIASVLPDFVGRLWFSTKGGLVGIIDPQSGAVTSLRLEGEAIANSFAVDESGGVFLVSDHALYRFDRGPDGQPTVTWREPYDRGTRLKPGQFSQGSGTTPTLMGSDFVAITDNADPRMQVLVYRRAPEVEGPRLVCAEPVFGEGESNSENSIIATDRSLVVENNYGYRGPLATQWGRTTAPGMTRIDLDPAGGCRTVWSSRERIPNVVSKLSLATGLLYTYSKEPGPGFVDPWYFTAIDFETGETVFKQLTGRGFLFNSSYAGLYLGPDGTAYIGATRGIIAIRDRPAP